MGFAVYELLAKPVHILIVCFGLILYINFEIIPLDALSNV
jgi:hypothetical protein